MDRVRIMKTNLINYKKCSKCNENLSLNQFEKYGGQRGKKEGLQSYRTICKECRVKSKTLRLLKKKYKIILQYFNGVCCECGTNLSLLPSFEFHHPDPKLKTISWRKISGKSYKEIINWIKHDKVIALCGNCHAKKQATNFIIAEKLILEKNLFNKTAIKINNLVREFTNTIPLNKRPYRKNSKLNYIIKKWIRKRYVIENLFKGRCVGCGKIIVDDNLPSGHLHHLKPKILKIKSKWDDIAHLDCEEIIKIIRKEKCVFLCSNCHTLIETEFDELVDKITDNVELIRKVKITFNTIQINIFNFEVFKDDVSLQSPLKKPIKRKWMIDLLKIHYYLEKKHSTIFNINLLVNNLGDTYHALGSMVRRLTKKGYIKIAKNFGHQKRYMITLSGIEKAKEIENDNNLEAQNIKRKITNKKIQLKNSKKDYTDDILLKYCTVIYKVIQKKSTNEFVISELVPLLGRSFSTVSKHIRFKLISYNLIEILNNPKSKKLSHGNVYKITEKGIQLAKSCSDI